MKNFTSLLLSGTMFCCTQSTLAQTPEWTWAKSSGSVSNDYSNAVCTDVDGNVYMTGTFQGSSITFGNFVLQNTSEGFLDIFIVKYDDQGNVIWAVSDGGIKDDYAYGICVDLQRNVFITGYFTGPSLVFGTSVLVNESTNDGPPPDVFIAKYDSNGNVQWGKSGDSEIVAYSRGICLDVFGNVYITGSFGPPSVTFGDHTFSSNFGYDMFIVKYDTNGDILWANQMGGPNTDQSRAICTDAIGNVYVTGSFQNSATFGSNTLVSSNLSGDEIFVAKFDGNGNNVWARYALVPNYGNYASGTGIATDSEENVYITGYYQYSLSFGNDTLSNTGNHGIFLAKYDSSGNPLWGRSPGGTGTDIGSAVCTDPDGNVIVTGYYGSSFLNFGGNLVINANVGYEDVFLAKYDSNGDAIWATGIGGADREYGMGVASSTEGEVYLTGYFGSYMVNLSETFLTNNGSYDTFLAKIPNDAVISVQTIEGNLNVKVYPNPAYDQITAISAGFSEVRIYDASSREILIRKFSNSTTIDVTGLQTGLYLYELVRNGTFIKGKFIKE